MDLPKKSSTGLPDLRWINRNVPITEVAKQLGLRFGGHGQIHCWHPERHQHGDRTASVGIRIKNNTVKCFGCDSRPFGPVDLVMDVYGIKSPMAAAVWISTLFSVPLIPKGQHLVQPPSRIGRMAGFEGDTGVLVQSGLWAQLSAPARSIAPVLAYFADKASGQSIAPVTISYRAISRYSGVNSPNAVAKGIRELAEIGWLVRDTTEANPGQTVRAVSRFFITPQSDELIELAQSHVKQMKNDIEVEREVRKQQRTDRLRTLRKLGPTSSATAVTEYKSLYSGNSAEQNGAIPCIAGVWRGRSSHQNGHEFAARSSLSTTPSRCAEAKPRLAKIAAGLRASNNRRGPRLVQDRKSLRARAARTNHSTFAADKDSRHAGSGLLKRAPLPSAAVPREATIPSRPPAKLTSQIIGITRRPSRPPKTRSRTSDITRHTARRVKENENESNISSKIN